MKKYMLVLMFLLMPAMVFGLALEYMRNGECYLLIGHSDTTFRGVYRLNNPSGEPDGNPVNAKLFDPRTSYGISVNLARKVYTFSENKAPTYTLGNWPQRRLLKAPGDTSLWGAHCDTRKSYYVSNEGITYNQAGRPVYTTTGPMGPTHPSHPENVSWHWSGIVKPTIKEAGRWYFQKTQVLCDGNCIYTNGYSDAFWLYFVSVDGSGHGYIPNNSWWQSRDKDPHGRPGNIFYWDRVYRKYTYYDLNYWDKTMGIWSPSKPVYGLYTGVADSIFDEIVQRSRISACLNCVCVNGSGDQNFKAYPKFTSLAMSPFGRMYLYTRTENSTSDGEIRMNGTALNPNAANIRGDVNDITTQWVGISAASKTLEYIYLLGTNLIKKWLKEYNIKPATLNITSVAVSDQWWLDGGIVYAYDADEGAAYKFIRFDKAGNNTCKSIPQKVVIGKGVDAIKADGFGNLFFAKTTKEPASTTNISWPELYTFYFYQIYAGRAYGYVFYRQKVFKTVFCQELGATGNYQVGKVHIGNNIFRRAFSVPQAGYNLVTLANIKTKASEPGWIWQTGFQQVSIVSDPSLTQLGVINVATPPKVAKPNGNLGVVDIVGIEDVDASFKYLTDEVRQGLYTYRIENAPFWEGRNNIATPGKNKWEGDKNLNGYEGGFVSTIMNSSSLVDSSPEVRYNWKIYKIQDAFGNPQSPPQLVKELVNTTGSAVTYYFKSGVYQIMCSAQFKWYDYDSLPFGSTVEDINSCIRPGVGMDQATAAPKDPGINSTAFPGMVSPVPVNAAVTMLKVNRQLPLPSGKKLGIQRLASSIWKDPKESGAVIYHVVDEKVENSWRLQPDPKDPASKYLQDLYNLPAINNSNMVPNTLVWKNNMPAQYEWTFTLTLPDGTIYPAQELSKSSWSAADAPIKFKLDYPTDPVMGKLTCKAYREWQYLENDYTADGSYIGQKPVNGIIEYYGEVDVLVLDKTAPKIIAVNGNNFDGTPINPIYLGITGGMVTENLSHGGYTNPASFSILVEDNNIFANMNAIAPVAAADRLHNRGSKQKATFFFERGAGKELFPSSSEPVTYNYYSSPGVSLATDVKEIWVKTPAYKVMRKPLPWKWGDTSSYILYAFDVSDWRHMQTGLSGSILSDPARWPINFANNSPSYQADGGVGKAHPGYAVMFQAADSSGQTSVRTHLGNVWIRDNLLPMAYSKTTDYIKSFDENQPFDITKYLVTHPKSAEAGFPWYGQAPNTKATWQTSPTGFPSYDHLPNNLAIWQVNNDGNYPTLGDLLGVPPGLNKKLTNYHPPIIQEGMEVFIEVFAADNIAVSNTVMPTIQVQGPSGLYTEGAAAMIKENSGNTMKLRLLLQRSGVYDVTLSAEDNALDFANKPAPNKRTVKFGIVVGPATMDIRVIDKSNTDF